MNDQKKLQIVNQMERKLKAEGCDLLNSGLCVQTLSKCVLPKPLIEAYNEKYLKTVG